MQFTYSFPNFNGATVKINELTNVISQFTERVIIYRLGDPGNFIPWCAQFVYLFLIHDVSSSHASWVIFILLCYR